jgi:predicted nucleic acid-binding protein
MKYVVDSSVAFKWVVPEVDSDKADLLRADFLNGIHEFLAPDVYPVEDGCKIGGAHAESNEGSRCSEKS